MEIEIEQALRDPKPLFDALTFASYCASRDDGMPYRPTEKSIWGAQNDDLEAAYQATFLEGESA